MSSLVLTGDCTVVMPSLPEDSFDACVTDPPYHLSTVKRFGRPGSAPAKSEGASGVYKRASAGFMGQQWDGGDVAFNPETWAEVLRVLKPGAHLVAFGGSRTYHRLACAIEDAGFEVRDQIMWLYGSGFPKSHNQGVCDCGYSKGKRPDHASECRSIRQPEWIGWGTALKPAHEPIVLARKPLDGTVAKNLAAHGCGALNIDECRVEAEAERPWRQPSGNGTSLSGSVDGSLRNEIEDRSHLGRWPANVCHDGSDEVVGAFPESKGQLARAKDDGSLQGNKVYGALRHGTKHPEPRNDTGSAARFFYCAKASKKDKDDGLEDTKNTHPTVKPTDLMRWLCRLVTPPGGAILDPFIGSGSTGRGAVAEGFRFVGIEQDEKYAAVAKARIAAAEVDT